MLEKFVKEENQQRLGKLSPSSHSVFSNNGAERYLINQIFNPQNQEGWKKGLMHVLNCGAHIGYGCVEATSRVGEVGLYLGGTLAEKTIGISQSLIELLGNGVYEVLETVQDGPNQDGPNQDGPVKQYVGEFREQYRSLKEEFCAWYNSTKQRFNENNSQKKHYSVVGSSLVAMIIAASNIFGGEEVQTPSLLPPLIRPLEPPRPRPIEPRPQTYTQRTPQQIPVNPISEFDDNHVLIYCANDDERISIRDNLRSHRIRMRRTGNGRYTTRWHGSQIDIIVDGSRIPRNDYGIIQLRGHTSDMPHLFQRARNHGRNNILTILGGCNSDRYIDDYAQPNNPIIGSHGTQHSAQNTYLLGQILRDMDHVSSWEELSRRVKGRSERAALETIFPSNTNYTR